MMDLARESRTNSERGAILPLATILILVLMGFAALGVDVSAAYAERRQSQSAADAGALAGALKYLESGSPTSQEVADTVMSFANTNAPGTPPSATDWATCTDTLPPNYQPLRDASNNIISPCISLKQVSDAPALLRVRMPDWDMPTAFASVIGFDTLSISTVATAELQYSALALVLPTSLPSEPSVVECLGTPPSGQLPPSDGAGPCNGPANGNFGLVDSPWFGAPDPHFTNTPPGCKDKTSEWEDRAAHSLALGLDHLITEWPDSLTLQPPGNWESGPKPPSGDHCDSANSGDVPYVLNPRTGNTAVLERGLIGNDASVTAASEPGRLRQASSSPIAPGTRLTFNVTGWPGGAFNLDNVGLWEYIDSTYVDALTENNDCKSSNFDDKTGRELTEQMTDCLKENIDNLFIEELHESPRFALVPVLNYNIGQQFGNKWWAVTEMRPVYLHSTWYDCDSNDFCLFHPDDLDQLDVDDDTTYSYVFNPGESSVPPCYRTSKKGTACGNPANSKFQLQGISAFVLEWDELIVDAQNQLGGNAPFEVFLHPNE